MAACFIFHYRDSDERRLVVSLGHHMSSRLLTFCWVKALLCFLVLAVVPVGPSAAPHLVTFPHEDPYSRRLSFDLLSPHRRIHVSHQCFVFPCFPQTKHVCPLSYQTLSPSAGPGRKHPLWWRIPVHREPPRAAPSPRENRGHRRLAAPLLPVSRLITACHACAITRARGHAGKWIQATRPCTPGDLFIPRWAICTNRSVESSSAAARTGCVGGFRTCEWIMAWSTC